MSISLSLFAGVGAQLFTDSGSPLSGGLVYTYLAGTSTPVTSYTSVSGITANSNPIVLNAAGRTPAEVWLTDGVGVKFVVKTATGTTIGTYDNVFSTDSGGTDVLSLLAASSGSSLVGFIQSGSTAVARTEQAKLRDTVSPEDFGAVGDGVTDDTVALQAAITALDSGQTLHLENDYVIKGLGLTITNKTRITIEGPGRLKLVGADAGAIILNLVGTCSDIRVFQVSFLGEGNSSATYFQYGIWNASGQTLSNIIVSQCYFKNLNAGVSFNADAGGTVTNVMAVNNIVEDMVGTLGGQGYGLFASKAQNVQFCNNEINRCSRHSIYVARGATASGTDYGTLIHSNIIKDHRSVGFGAIARPAIYCVRGYGYSIKNNKIIDYYDGGIAVSQDTVDGTSCGDCEVVGNNLYGRKNAVASMWAGETSNPTTYRINNVKISGNVFTSDITVGGYAQEINVYNGTNIDVTDNYFYVSNITNIAYRPIVLGEYSAAGVTDLNRVNVLRNTFNGTSAFIPVRFVYCATAICTGASQVRIADNDIDPALLNATVQFQVTQTNKKIVVKDQWGGTPGVYTAADATPSVWGGVTYLVVTNAVATNITSLLDPVFEQVITLVFGDANTTIKHATGNIRLVGGVDFVSSSRDTLTLIYSPVYAQWLEVSRAVVS